MAVQLEEIQTTITGDASGYVAATKSATQATESLEKTTEKASNTQKKAAESQGKFGEEVKRNLSPVAGLAGAVGLSEGAFRTAADSIEVFSGGLKGMAAATGIGLAALAIGKIVEWSGALESAEESVKRKTEALNKLTEEGKKYVTEQQAKISAANTFRDSLEAVVAIQTTSAKEVEQALERQRKAEEELAKARRERMGEGESVDEIAAAAKLAIATDEVVKAQARLAESNKTVEASQEGIRKQARELADSLSRQRDAVTNGLTAEQQAIDQLDKSMKSAGFSTAEREGAIRELTKRQQALVEAQNAAEESARAMQATVEAEKAAADELSNAFKEQEDRLKGLQSEADNLAKSLRTPLEIYQDSVTKLNELLEHGLSPEMFNRGLVAAQEQLARATQQTKDFQKEVKSLDAVLAGTRAARERAESFLFNLKQQSGRQPGMSAPSTSSGNAPTNLVLTETNKTIQTEGEKDRQKFDRMIDTLVVIKDRLVIPDLAPANLS